jgi:hypothetical protein
MVVDEDGLRHTAVMDGRFTTAGGQLYLITPNQRAVATCTYIIDAINGWCQSEFQCDNDIADYNYAGLLFRLLDKDWNMACYYDCFDDVIRLNQTRAGVETILATTGPMGWNPLTWYGLRVLYRYGRVHVYASTDLVTYATVIATEVPGFTSCADGSWWTWDHMVDGSMPFFSGRAGYTAQYYVDDSGGGGD